MGVKKQVSRDVFWVTSKLRNKTCGMCFWVTSKLKNKTCGMCFWVRVRVMYRESETAVVARGPALTDDTLALI